MASATLLEEEQWEMANVHMEIDIDCVETVHCSLNTLDCDAPWHCESSNNDSMICVVYLSVYKMKP